MPPSRRAFLRRAAVLAAAAFTRAPRAIAAETVRKPRFAAYPFSLGVASGSPRARSIVLWTRLAPSALEGGGMDPVSCEARWELAADDAFRRIVKSGTAIAAPERAHAVHVEVDGLDPAREYFYRFVAGDATSPVARTRTAPAPGQGDERLRLAFASCQQYEQGYYGAHRFLADEGVDLVAFLGDYIYESSWGRDHVRKHGTEEPRTLAEYRNRYALYKSDPDLQKSHACAPWISVWDDHEVSNDYANDRPQKLEPDFLARRAAAYRAYFEHMPLRPSVLREGGEVRIYDRHEWGSLATIHALDDRQYRSHQACPPEGRGGGRNVGSACTERLEEGRTLLGRAQERWLDEGLAQSRSRWNVIAQQTRFVEAGRPDGKGEIIHWTDGWDGYPAARARLLASIAERRPSNPVIIGGDVHANYVADIRARAGDRDSPVLAAEFCGTSISSQGNTDRVTQLIHDTNPDIAFAEASRRGYVVLDIGADRLEAKLRVVDSVKKPDMTLSTAQVFAVAAGRAGILK
jgi:alkaline phosphatase D